jgi:hypothetical protein
MPVDGNRADATSQRIEQHLMRWENVPALFLGQGGVDVQHEWIRVRARLRHDEGHIVRHQAGDEMDVRAQPIELGDDDRPCACAWP